MTALIAWQPWLTCLPESSWLPRPPGLPKSPRLPALLLKIALPGRLALRVLWASIRLEILIGAIEYLLDSLPYLELPFNFPELIGWPMIWRQRFVWRLRSS